MYKKNGIAYLFIIPMLIFLVIFLIYPFAINIYNSFFRYTSILDRNPVFTGFNNYKELITSRQFGIAIGNTFLLMVLVIIFQVGIALVLALLVNQITKFSSFYKISFFIPIIISATALGLMFQMFYKTDGGLFNQILSIFKIKPVTWFDLNNGKKFLYVMMMPVIWQYIGFYFVIFLTGLTTISNEMIEASKIDGASELQTTFKIKIPLIQNVTRVVIVLAITGTLKVFDLPYILNPIANPNGETYLLGTYMYNIAFFRNKNLGLAASFAVIMAVLGVGLSGVVNKIFKQNKDI
ncbi:carbohydrate ABC transporter permease [Haploplasma axanthum]|uniref:sn-glycerol-3-phosphate transport system permease protein ugpA n=1 Tax=Haploplasma axanthum TaxID=29552 RepID=A0A449BBZ3_HAPAX|nr:sugar ABC transporter permease [Haploplasma axanthum]VEU79830.1 sn-glycerol-3-phosphate transport system permease protein ugpA [Haploplasma axanthum]